MKIKRAEGLNIIPLIDVMLVLLAIVLSVSTFIAQGKIPITLPQDEEQTEPEAQSSRSTRLCCGTSVQSVRSRRS